MNTKEILIGARELIADPNNWTQGHYSYYGRYCAVGAVRKVVYDRQTHLVDLDRVTCQARQVLNHACRSTIINYNDTHTHEEVIAVFNKAIQSLEPKVLWLKRVFRGRPDSELILAA